MRKSEAEPLEKPKTVAEFVAGYIAEREGDGSARSTIDNFRQLERG